MPTNKLGRAPPHNVKLSSSPSHFHWQGDGPEVSFQQPDSNKFRPAWHRRLRPGLFSSLVSFRTIQEPLRTKGGKKAKPKGLMLEISHLPISRVPEGLAWNQLTRVQVSAIAAGVLTVKPTCLSRQGEKLTISPAIPALEFFSPLSLSALALLTLLAHSR